MVQLGEAPTRPYRSTCRWRAPDGVGPVRFTVRVHGNRDVVGIGRLQLLGGWASAALPQWADAGTLPPSARRFHVSREIG